MEAGSVVRAVFEFLPSVSEELPLFTGDVIEVLGVVDEFWLLGNKDGVTGKVSDLCGGAFKTKMGYRLLQLHGTTNLLFIKTNLAGKM